MIRIFPFFLLILLSSACGPSDSAPGELNVPASDPAAMDPARTEADGRALELLVADWVGMWNRYDLDQVTKLFLDDERLSYFSSEKEGLIRGMEAVLEHHRGFGFVPGGEQKGSRLWMEGVEVDPLGNAAVITGIWFFRSNPDSGGEPQRGPVTIVCSRTNAGWRFVHMNFSSYPEPEAPAPDPT